MPYQATHWATEPTRQAIDALNGANLLEFGTPWCGHCQRAQPLLQSALSVQPEVAHERRPGRGAGHADAEGPLPVEARDDPRALRAERAVAVHDRHRARVVEGRHLRIVPPGPGRARAKFRHLVLPRPPSPGTDAKGSPAPPLRPRRETLDQKANP